jgi:hypothetical protein
MMRILSQIGIAGNEAADLEVKQAISGDFWSDFLQNVTL